MKPKRTSVASPDPTPIRVVFVTMDTHLATTCGRAARVLERELPGLDFSVHAAAEWATYPGSLDACRSAIATADIVLVTMLFMEDHFQPILADLAARRSQCDALIATMSAGEVMRLTRMGGFVMDGSGSGALALLQKLRPKRKEGAPATAGARQMQMLRRLPKLLRFIPGTAQDVRNYLLVLQYFLAGSEENVSNMVRLLVSRYADGPRRGLRDRLHVGEPVEYPDVGLYHPRAKKTISDRVADLPGSGDAAQGTVGLLVLRSYVLAGNTRHYDGAIAALEARGLRVLPAFASGLDARPAIERFFVANGVTQIDALVSLTGFSLVGGPAYNDAKSAEDVLSSLDVPYVAAHPVEFGTLEEWGASERGLLPVENTMMVAIPELDGATGPIVFGGRARANGQPCTGCDRRCRFEAGEGVRDMQSCPERAEMLAARVHRLVGLRRGQRKDRRVAIVLFNFPPNGGSVGTAAFLSVFESVHRTLGAMRDAGYTVEVPPSGDALRDALLVGNTARYGTPANVLHAIPVDDHVRRERYLGEIERQWGAAPGRIQTDGRSLFVLGVQYGNVAVVVQPSLGYEGDPMRLLFERGHTPTHAFSAFYRYLREDFAAHAVLHFGTHGALEFMPGKQSGLSGSCWPDRLIGDLPHAYLYASNNPSEGSIAKRRSAATLVSYLTPPIARSGLYKGLLELKESVEHSRRLPADAPEQAALATVIQAQASVLEFVSAEPAWSPETRSAEIERLAARILEVEYTLIPHGLHVLGRAPEGRALTELLQAMLPADASPAMLDAVARVAEGRSLDQAAEGLDRATASEQRQRLEELAAAKSHLSVNHELDGVLRALDGRFIRPAPGGDVLRNPSVLPTGRNLHGFDPFRIPSATAVEDGARQADRLLARHLADGQPLPESVAIVLWGTDNLKTEGAPIGQALALLGARPRFDSYGRLAGASLIPLADLGRPRIDVVISLSGIFRDLLPLQIRMLADAAYLAAAADEPESENFVRKHALAYQAAHGCDLETAALRVFGNAEGAYGANVNHLIENGRWNSEDELAEAYTRRKSFAFGREGRPVQQSALLESALGDVGLTFQNLDSVEVGVTAIDTYFDTLGGITRAVRRAKGGGAVPVYIGDETQGAGTVRTLAEQVSLETRTRMLNPKWYEGMLEHGYEGVRQIEVHLTNTMGWSATTGEVAPWVYEQLTQTFVLDEAMRERLRKLNPVASAKVANRLLEAHDRNYWQPDPVTLEALRRAGDELEDHLEGVFEVHAA
jgi:magnesium chelatase subunit H